MGGFVPLRRMVPTKYPIGAATLGNGRAPNPETSSPTIFKKTSPGILSSQSIESTRGG